MPKIKIPLSQLVKQVDIDDKLLGACDMLKKVVGDNSDISILVDVPTEAILEGLKPHVEKLSSGWIKSSFDAVFEFSPTTT